MMYSMLAVGDLSFFVFDRTALRQIGDSDFVVALIDTLGAVSVPRQGPLDLTNFFLLTSAADV
jgi:hypothetical protein